MEFRQRAWRRGHKQRRAPGWRNSFVVNAIVTWCTAGLKGLKVVTTRDTDSTGSGSNSAFAQVRASDPVVPDRSETAPVSEEMGRPSEGNLKVRWGGSLWSWCEGDSSFRWASSSVVWRCFLWALLRAQRGSEHLLPSQPLRWLLFHEPGHLRKASLVFNRCCQAAG